VLCEGAGRSPLDLGFPASRPRFVTAVIVGALLVLGGDAGEAAGVLDARIKQLKQTAVESETAVESGIAWSDAA